jgi:hypothetical protein
MAGHRPEMFKREALVIGEGFYRDLNKRIEEEEGEEERRWQKQKIG